MDDALIAAAETLPDAGDLADLRDNLNRVLAERCDSRAVHAFIDGKSALDEDLWKTAAELGWLGVGLPAAYDGLGLGPAGLRIVHEELGRRMAPGPYIATLVAAQWLADLGGEAEKREILPQVAGGEITIAIPATIGAGAALSLRSGRVDGSHRVLGSPSSKLALVPVAEAGAAEAWALIPLDTAALTPIDLWDRTRQVCAMACEGVAPIVGIDDTGGRATRNLARHLALAIAGDSVGGAAGIAHQTIEYLKTRVQFDRPIGSFQALKHRAADLVSRIDVQEHLLAQAVETAVLGEPEADMWAALAKAGATDDFAFIAGDCIQLHGGVGHTWEFDVHIYVKRARLNQALGADNRQQRDFAAQRLADATRAGRSTTEFAP